MEFGQRKFREIDLFDFTSFFAWTFLNFLAHLIIYFFKYISRNVMAFFQIFEARPALQGAFSIDWTSLPELVHPLGGELPKERLEKKCQQLENLASAIDAIYHTGDVIVDFCSGTVL